MFSQFLPRCPHPPVLRAFHLTLSRSPLSLVVPQSRGSPLLGEALAAGAIAVGREGVQQKEKRPINSTTIISLPCGVADELDSHQMTARWKVSYC